MKLLITVVVFIGLKLYEVFIYPFIIFGKWSIRNHQFKTKNKYLKLYNKFPLNIIKLLFFIINILVAGAIIFYYFHWWWMAGIKANGEGFGGFLIGCFVILFLLLIFKVFNLLFNALNPFFISNWKLAKKITENILSKYRS